MRTYVDLARGVVSLDASGNESEALLTWITPSLDQLPDVSAFGVLDIELRIHALEIAELVGAEKVVLHLESSMQNNEEAPELWAPFSEDGSGLDLTELTAPTVMSFTQSGGILRYFRWRVEIPGHAEPPAVTVKFVFQLRAFGRSS